VHADQPERALLLDIDDMPRHARVPLDVPRVDGRATRDLLDWDAPAGDCIKYRPGSID